MLRADSFSRFVASGQGSRARRRARSFQAPSATDRYRSIFCAQPQPIGALSEACSRLAREARVPERQHWLRWAVHLLAQERSGGDQRAFSRQGVNAGVSRCRSGPADVATRRVGSGRFQLAGEALQQPEPLQLSSSFSWLVLIAMAKSSEELPCGHGPRSWSEVAAGARGLVVESSALGVCRVLEPGGNVVTGITARDQRDPDRPSVNSESRARRAPLRLVPERVASALKEERAEGREQRLTASRLRASARSSLSTDRARLERPPSRW